MATKILWILTSLLIVAFVAAIALPGMVAS